ncbi:hypothetical protein ABEB36_013676 [Hypothenemus hampei]|uniref:Uncharacterized protein n=1 Tax=Hypothenemus hampei TaxID=57062 RepID=A0ABD1E4Y3_HYPHA
MGFPEVSNCCGLSLKYGTIIIGVVQSIFAFMCFILSAAYAAHPHELIEINDPSVIPEAETLKAMLIIISVSSGLQCIFSILLIFGAAANHPSLLSPWLILNPICLFVYIIGTLVAIIHHGTNNGTKFLIGHIMTSVLGTMLVSFQILIVYSFRQHLKRLNF